MLSPGLSVAQSGAESPQAGSRLPFPDMANPQVKDTLAVMAVSLGAVTLVLLVLSGLTGSHWWVVVIMVMATLVIAICYYQERRRFRRDEAPPFRAG
jgi:low temperature requirement protein LtrA